MRCGADDTRQIPPTPKSLKPIGVQSLTHALLYVGRICGADKATGKARRQKRKRQYLNADFACMRSGYPAHTKRQRSVNDDGAPFHEFTARSGLVRTAGPRSLFA